MNPQPHPESARCWLRMAGRGLGWAVGGLTVVGLMVLGVGPAAAQSFGDPEVLAAEPGVQHQLTRNPQGTAGFTDGEVLHLVQWNGGLATTPSTTSSVWWHRWDRVSGWTGGQRLEDSRTTPAGTLLGGRQPSLLVPTTGPVTVVWHDHRHCDGAGNWINNLEIYGVELDQNQPIVPGPLGGEVRLTQTANPGIGDNGYTPRLARLPDGRTVVIWYDYGLQANISDIYVHIGGAGAGLNPAPYDLPATRRTVAADRGNTPAFTLPDGAVTSDGVIHLSWMTGVGVGDLWTATLPPPYTTLVGATAIATGVADFLDPPRIVAAPSGDVWIVAKDSSAADGGQIALWRKPAGQSGFLAPVRPVVGPGPRAFPTVAFADDGSLILAYSDRSTDPGFVRLARLDGGTGAVQSQMALTPGGNYTRLALARSPVVAGGAGAWPRLALIAEEITGTNTSRLIHWSTIGRAAADQGWELYY